MWPRLRLLFELLREGGLIFVAIDHNEAQRLRSLMDETFGEENFIANVVWQKRTSPEARKRLGQAHDSIIVFKKGSTKESLSKLDDDEEDGEEDAENRDNDKRGPWTSTDFSAQNPDPTKRKDQQYQIKLPSGRVISPSTGRCWSTLEPEFDRLRTDNRIWFGVDGDARPRIKNFVLEGAGSSAWTWWPNSEVGHNQEAKKELLRILGDEETFDYPKPTRLVGRILKLATDKNSLILDSFAGSGTTAHAVLEANRRDGGNRRFILVEMEGYADRLTAERVRRVITGYPFKGTLKTELHRESLTWSKLQNADRLTETVEKIENLHGHEYDKITKRVDGGELIVTGERAVDEQAPGLGGEFTYCTLGDPIEMDRILSGQDLPAFGDLGTVLFHTATNQTCDPALIDPATGYLGEAGGAKLWLIYRPDLAWLKTPQAALTLDFAKGIAAGDPQARHIVFAPANHTSTNLLKHHKITTVEFAPLPYALYRVNGG